MHHLDRARTAAVRTRCAMSWLVLAAALSTAAAAQSPTGSAAPAQANQPVPSPGNKADETPEATGFWDRANLLGDMGGLRAALDEHGITFNLLETSEVLGNPSGGRAQGTIYEGLTQATLIVDLGKAIGLAGGTFNASAFQIHGRGLSANNVGNLQTISSIDADRGTRLFELWYQQSFLDGRADVKLGQQSADLEFLVTQYGAVFINSSFGWPTLAAVDLPSGGPAYPLATPGARLRVRPADNLAVLIGLFNGSPAGLGGGDPQQRDPAGTNFDVGSGAFVIGEVQYSINQGDGAAGLTGTYKLGAWYNSNAFQDPYYATAPAAALPGPSSARRGDWSVYAVADQLMYRAPGTPDGGAGVFLRAMNAPGGRNQVDVFIDGGMTYKGAFGRADDTIGIGVGWARISGRTKAGDAALAAASGSIRSGETVIEVTYQAQMAPWWVIQPDLQYVANPGGGIPDPAAPARRIGNATILGLRTVVTF